MVYLVAYDLNNEGSKRPNITKIVYQYAYAKLSESSYALDTDEDADEIFEKFKKVLDDDDHLYVIPLKGPYAGWGPKKVIDWLSEALE